MESSFEIMEFASTLIELSKGASFLLAITYVLAWRGKVLGQGRFRENALAGLFIGMAAVVGMMIPMRLGEGVIFDGRSILIGVGSAVGGVTVAIFTVLPSVLYRIYLGGQG